MQKGDKVIDGGADLPKLKIQKPGATQALAAGEEEKIFGMKIAQFGDPAGCAVINWREHIAPCGTPTVPIKFHPRNRAIPVEKQVNLIQPAVEPVPFKVRRRRMANPMIPISNRSIRLGSGTTKITP